MEDRQLDLALLADVEAPDHLLDPPDLRFAEAGVDVARDTPQQRSQVRGIDGGRHLLDRTRRGRARRLIVGRRRLAAAANDAAREQPTRQQQGRRERGEVKAFRGAHGQWSLKATGMTTQTATGCPWYSAGLNFHARTACVAASSSPGTESWILVSATEPSSITSAW